LVTLSELLVAARRDGGAHAVGAVQLGRAAELPQGVLQAFGQALVTLGEADGARLPVGVSQYEVVGQGVERLAVDGGFQLTAAGEVAGAEAAGMVDLVEEDLLVGAVRGAPGLDAPLQGADLPVGEAPREATLQVFEEGLDLQAGVDLKFLDHLRPDFG